MVVLGMCSINGYALSLCSVSRWNQRACHPAKSKSAAPPIREKDPNKLEK
jgi:hypothetical protein